MPRTAGVSSSSTVWLMRRSPRPRTVARWLSRVPIRPRTSVTLTFLPDFASALSAGFLKSESSFVAAVLPTGASPAVCLPGAFFPAVFFSVTIFSGMVLAQDLFYGLAALGRDLGGGAHPLQTVDRGANDGLQGMSKIGRAHV